MHCTHKFSSSSPVAFPLTPSLSQPYRLSADSMKVLRGVTPDMCATSPLPPGSSWNAGSFVEEGPDATADSAAEQWAELGGGW